MPFLEEDKNEAMSYQKSEAALRLCIRNEINKHLHDKSTSEERLEAYGKIADMLKSEGEICQHESKERKQFSEEWESKLTFKYQNNYERQKIREYFEANIKPQIIRVHPDFDAIMKDEGYWQWAEQQPTQLKHAALTSGNPSDIIWAINEYKKFKAAQPKSVILTPVGEDIIWDEKPQ